MSEASAADRASAAAWIATLDALERDLDALQADIASGATEGERPSVDLPMHLGPLPEDLRARAVALHARMREAEQALVVAVDRSRRDVAFTDRLAPASPHFLDARW